MYILPKEGGCKRELSFYGVYFLGKENFRTGEDEIHKHIFQINLKKSNLIHVDQN